MSRRVVITGLGAVSGPGVGFAALWQALLDGRSAVAPITRFDPAGFPCRYASELRDFSARDHVPKGYRKAVKVMCRDTEIAVAAARLAAEDAGITTLAAHEANPAAATTYPAGRSGCHIGAGLIATETLELTSALATARTESGSPAAGGFDHRAWGSGDGGGAKVENLQPLWMLKYLPNMLACHVTIIHGLEGPSNTITCGEASGILSLGESTRVIQRGDADLCFSGGAESKLNLMGLLHMGHAERLAATEDGEDGAAITRPYDPASRGSVIGEGGGILILEELGSARARGARPYAEIVGFGAAQSGWYLGSGWDAPPPGAPDDGLQYAIENALDDAGLTPADIDAIVPHGCGVPDLDQREAATLEAVFGRRLEHIPLITLVPTIGETSAGAGALSAAVAAMAIREQTLPARINAGAPRPTLQAAAAPATPRPLTHVLSVTGALGGQNAAVILRSIA